MLYVLYVLFLMVMVPVLFIYWSYLFVLYCRLFYCCHSFISTTVCETNAQYRKMYSSPHYSLQLALSHHLVDENYIGKILPLYKESMEGDPHSLTGYLSLQGLVLIKDKGWNGQLEDRPAPTTNPMPMEVKQLDLKIQRIGSYDKMSKCQNVCFLV